MRNICYFIVFHRHDYVPLLYFLAHRFGEHVQFYFLFVVLVSYLICHLEVFSNSPILFFFQNSSAITMLFIFTTITRSFHILRRFISLKKNWDGDNYSLWSATKLSNNSAISTLYSTGTAMTEPSFIFSISSRDIIAVLGNTKIIFPQYPTKSAPYFIENSYLNVIFRTKYKVRQGIFYLCGLEIFIRTAKQPDKYIRLNRTSF